MEATASGNRWFLMIDPAWRPADEDDEPPPEAVVGGWYLDSEGIAGRFHPNPDYEPSRPGLPTDPMDAVLQLALRGEIAGEEALRTADDVELSIALHADGAAVVAPAPDGVPSVLVTTAPVHRERVDVDDWATTTVDELAEALPDEGVDVLFNPGAPASMRIETAALKRYAAQPVQDGPQDESAD